MKKKKIAQYRVDVYKLVERIIGRDLSNAEHDEIRAAFIGAATGHAKQLLASSVVSEIPLERYWVCSECKTKEKRQKKTGAWKKAKPVTRPLTQ